MNVPIDLIFEQKGVGGDQFDIVTEFYYLQDLVLQVGFCANAVKSRIQSTWMDFHELLPLLTNKGISLSNRSNVF